MGYILTIHITSTKSLDRKNLRVDPKDVAIRLSKMIKFQTKTLKNITDN